MLIDFHSHIFPDKIASRSLDVLKAGVWEQEHKSAIAHFDGTAVGLRNSMRENLVDISVTLPIATKPTQTESINSFAKNISDGKIISFASLHPQNDNTDEILEKIKSDGFVGIKLHPEFQKCYINSKECIKILQKAEELKLYTAFHAGADIGLPPPVHSSPKTVKQALNYVSGKYIILAHLGGFRMWDDVEKYLVGTDVFFDTAFIKDFIAPDTAKRIITSHGCDKILFGSDNPWEAPSDTLKFINSLGLSKDDTDKITHLNALKILKTE